MTFLGSKKHSLQQSSVVIPFSIEDALAGVLNELVQTAAEEGWRAALYLYGVYPHTLVEGRELKEVPPHHGVGTQLRQYVVRNGEAAVRHVGQHGSSCCRHQSQPLQSAATLLVQFGPVAAGLPRTELLGGDAGRQLLRGAVYPSGTQGFLHGIKIPEGAIVLGSATLHYDPAFCRIGMIACKPVTQFLP